MDGIDKLLYAGEVYPEFTGSTRNWKFHPGSLTKQIVPFDVVDIVNATTLQLAPGHGLAVNDEVALVAGLDPEFTAPETYLYPTGVTQHKKLYVKTVSTNNIELSLTSGGAAITGWHTTGDENTYLENNLKVYKANAGYFDVVQGRPEFFPTIDFTFSGIAYVEVWLNSTQTEMEEEPTNFKIFVRGRKLVNYDENGLIADVTGTAYPDQNNLPADYKLFSANNALVAADVILNYMKVGHDRIDWPSFCKFRDHCDEVIDWQSGSTETFSSPDFTFTNGFTTAPIVGSLLAGAIGSNVNDWETGAKTTQTFDPTKNNKLEVTYTAGHSSFGFTRNTAPTTWNQFLYGFHISQSPGGTNKFYATKGSTIVDVGTRVLGAKLRIECSPTKVEWFINDSVVYIDNAPNYGSGNPLVGGFAFATANSRFSDIKMFPIAGSSTRPINRFDAHIVFPSEIPSTVALEQAMGRAPSCHWQDVNGKIKFIVGSGYKDLTIGEVPEDGDRVLVSYLAYDPNGQPEARTNVASVDEGAVATASSTYSSNPYFYADSVISGLRRVPNWGQLNSHYGNGWNSGGTPSPGSEEWIEVAFDGAKTINLINVFSVGNPENKIDENTLEETTTSGLYEFYVQYWDGDSWENISHVTANDKVWNQFNFDPITTTKIRLFIVYGASGGYARVAEIEAFTVAKKYPIKSNIVENSFSTYKKPVEEKQNFLRMEFRDIEDPVFLKKYSYKDRPALRDYVRYLVDFGIVQIGVASQSLADRVSEAIIRWNSDLDLFVTVKGQPSTFGLSKGDLVKFAHDVPEWSLEDAPTFIIVEEAFDADSADVRSFTLQIYDSEYYSDTAHGPISPSLPSTGTSQLIPPPIVNSLTVSEDYALMPDNKYVSSIKGEIEFGEYYTQHADLYVKELANFLTDVTYNSGTNVFTVSAGFSVPNNMTALRLVSTSDNVPDGIDFESKYYVTNVSGSTFKLSLTSGGAGTAESFTTNGANLKIYEDVNWRLIPEKVYPDDNFLGNFEIFPAKKAFTLVRAVTKSSLDVNVAFSSHPVEHVQISGSQIPPEKSRRMFYDYDGVTLQFKWDTVVDNVERYRVTDEFNRTVTESTVPYYTEGNREPMITRRVYSVSPTGLLSSDYATSTFVLPPKLEWINKTYTVENTDKSLTTNYTGVGFKSAQMKSAVILGDIVTRLMFRPHADNVAQGIAFSGYKYDYAFLYYTGVYFNANGTFGLSPGSSVFGNYNAGDEFVLEDNPVTNEFALYKREIINGQTVEKKIHTYGSSGNGLFYIRVFTTATTITTIDLNPILIGNITENSEQATDPAINVVNATYSGVNAARVSGSGWGTSGLSIPGIPADRQGFFEMSAFGGMALGNATGIAVGLTNSDTNQNITSMPFWFTVDGSGNMLFYTGNTLLHTEPSGGSYGTGPVLGLERFAIGRRGTEVYVRVDDFEVFTYTHASLDTEALSLDIAFNGSLGSLWAVNNISVTKPYSTLLTPDGEFVSFSVGLKDNAIVGKNLVYDIPKFNISGPVDGEYLAFNADGEVVNVVGGGGLVSGTPVSGGDPDAVLYIDGSGNLSTDANFVYNGTDLLLEGSTSGRTIALSNALYGAGDSIMGLTVNGTGATLMIANDGNQGIVLRTGYSARMTIANTGEITVNGTDGTLLFGTDAYIRRNSAPSFEIGGSLNLLLTTNGVDLRTYMRVSSDFSAYINFSGSGSDAHDLVHFGGTSSGFKAKSASSTLHIIGHSSQNDTLFQVETSSNVPLFSVDQNGKILISRTDASKFLTINVESGRSVTFAGNTPNYPNVIPFYSFEYYDSTYLRGIKLTDVGNGFQTYINQSGSGTLYWVDHLGNPGSVSLGSIGNPSGGGAITSSYMAWYIPKSGGTDQSFGINGAPSTHLHVRGATTAQLRLEYSGTKLLDIEVDTAGVANFDLTGYRFEFNKGVRHIGNQKKVYTYNFEHYADATTNLFSFDVSAGESYIFEMLLTFSSPTGLTLDWSGGTATYAMFSFLIEELNYTDGSYEDGDKHSSSGDTYTSRGNSGVLRVKGSFQAGDTGTFIPRIGQTVEDLFTPLTAFAGSYAQIQMADSL